jgi:hypothetical protein
VSTFDAKKIPRDTAVQFEGVFLQGCEFDGKQLCDITDMRGTSVELVDLPVVYVAWVGEKDANPYPEKDTADIPVYHGLDRENLLCVLKLPNHGTLE